MLKRRLRRLSRRSVAGTAGVRPPHLLDSLCVMRLIVSMGNRLVGDVYIVAATKDSRIDYWVAATRREDAVAAVQRLLAPEWKVTVTERRITAKQVAVLHLSPNGVRKLRYVP
jgi:hypothetical protein